MDFLGYDRKYTEMMLVDASKQNGGRYDSSSVLEAEVTKSMLRQFYIRPNLELYRLLHETGHEQFLPFESYLQKLKHLDCKAEKNINTGLCGTTLTSNQIEYVPTTNAVFLSFIWILGLIHIKTTGLMKCKVKAR